MVLRVRVGGVEVVREERHWAHEEKWERQGD